MAKIDKELQARIQGMIFAYNIAKDKGVEELYKDIKMRGITKAPMKYTKAQIDEFYNTISTNVYWNMLTAICTVLHEEFGFGKVRIMRVKDHFNDMMKDVMSLNWMGEHYVNLGDFAMELNRKYDMGINISNVMACDDVADESNPRYGMANMDKVITELTEAGFKDAAEYLQEKRS